jgi:hypothetical protein
VAGVGAAALLAFGEIEAAFEAVYFQAHRAGFAEHGQRASTALSWLSVKTRD